MIGSASGHRRDLDGAGGSDPTVDSLILGSASTYSGTVRLLNETVNPTGDVTEEITREGTSHQFFYDIEGGLAGQVTVDITDTDEGGLPLGLALTVTVEENSAGTTGALRVRLYHYPNADDKDGTSISDETDVDIVFPVRIN